MEKYCTLCPTHCPKNAIQCVSGKAFFGEAYNKNLEILVSADLNNKIRKCGRLLAYETGKEKTQERVMEIVYLNQPISQRHLQDILSIKPGSMSEILRKLEKKHYLTKHPDPSDKRKQLIELTYEGETFVENKESNKSNALDVLSDEEKMQLGDMLDRIIKQLS